MYGDNATLESNNPSTAIRFSHSCLANSAKFCMSACMLPISADIALEVASTILEPIERSSSAKGNPSREKKSSWCPKDAIAIITASNIAAFTPNNLIDIRITKVTAIFISTALTIKAITAEAPPAIAVDTAPANAGLK